MCVGNGLVRSTLVCSAEVMLAVCMKGVGESEFDIGCIGINFFFDGEARYCRNEFSRKVGIV